MKQYPFKKTTIDGNCITYFENEYSGEGTPLLMIPGWPMPSLTLLPLMNKISEKFKCIAVNPPGFGSSQANDKVVHNFEYYSNFIHKFCEQLQISKKNIFGYSTGGVMGLDFALKYPDELDKLIVLSPPYNGLVHVNRFKENSPNGKRLFNTFSKYSFLPGLLSKWPINKFVFGSMAMSNYMKKYPELKKLDSQFMKCLCDEACKINAKAVFELALDISKSEYEKLVSKVQAETLVIGGTIETAVTPEDTLALANLLPHSHLIEIPNADHDLGASHPELISDEIMNFLSNNSETTPKNPPFATQPVFLTTPS